MTPAAPLRDVAALLDTDQPAGDIADVEADLSAYLVENANARAALDDIPIGELGSLAALDPAQALPECETTATGGPSFSCAVTFATLLRLYAVSGDDGLFELMSRYVGATTAALKPRHRKPYLAELASGLAAYRTLFPALGEGAGIEPDPPGDVGADIDWDELWDYDATGWTPEPTAPDPEYAAAAVEICLEEREVLRPMRGDLPELEQGPTLHDQRGEAGALLQWTTPKYSYSCFIYWDTTGFGGGFETLGNSYVALGPDALTVPVFVTSRSSGSISELEGQMDPAAARVEIETEGGQRIEATHGDGHFIAWWPARDPARAVRVYAADGSLIAEETTDKEGHFPFTPRASD